MESQLTGPGDAGRSPYKLMHRMSIRTVIVVIPLVSALGFSAWSFSENSRRINTLRQYDSALKSGQMLPLPGLERCFGQAMVRQCLSDSARSNPDLVFDGESRVAQVRRDSVSDSDLDGTGDAIALYALGSGHVTCELNSLVGARIDCVNLSVDTLEVTLHGKLRWKGYGCNIDELNPQTYILKWSPDTIADTNLHSVIWKAQQSKVFEIPDR